MATTMKARPLGNSSCPYHSDKVVIYICEDCPEGTLACLECVTSRHRTHRLEKLTNIIPWKKEQVLRYIDATETHHSPSIQKDIATLDIKLLENKTTFQDLILDMKTNADHWKSSIDRYVETNVRTFLDIEKENTEILLKHKRKLLNDSSDIKEMLVNRRNTLQGGNPVQIFDIKIDHHVQSTFPRTKTAKFKRREFSQESLPHVFGLVEIDNVIPYEKPATPPRENVGLTFLKPQQNPRLARRNSTGRIKEISVTKKLEQKPSFLKVEQNSKRVRRNSVTEQLIRPSKKNELKPTTKKISNTRRHSTSTRISIDNTVHTKQSSNPSDTEEGQGQCQGRVRDQGNFESQSQKGGYTLVSPAQLVMFESPNGSVDFISPTKDDQAWVCKYNDTSVRLLDLMGDIQEEVVSPSGITGVSVAPDTSNFWLSCLDRGIREIVPQKPKTPPTKSNSDGNINVISHRPNKMHRQKSVDCSMKEMSQNSKRIQHQMSEDFCKSHESNASQRKSSFDSSISEHALQKHKFGLNELRPNCSKRRKSITKSLNEVEARLAGFAKCTESNPHSDEYPHFSNKPPVLPSINIIPPDSNSSIVCIFDNSEEALPRNPPRKKSLESSAQPTIVHHRQNQESPQCSLEQQTGGKLREVNGRAVVRFYVDDTPWSLCVTKDNNILIGTANTIIIYTTWGQVLHQVNKESWFTYTSPRVTSLQQMVQCPVSCNIAVIGQSHQGTHHVFIMDSALNLLSSYTGEKDSSDMMPAISTSPFSAAALCYDSVGHLVVADSNNRSIVLISGTGLYLKTLHQDTWATQAVGIQEDNTLWAAFKLYSNVEVKLFKYTE